jgi:hypothetical protein
MRELSTKKKKKSQIGYSEAYLAYCLSIIALPMRFASCDLPRHEG